MSTNVQLHQSSQEEISYPLDFSPQFLAGVTLQDVQVTHVPPTGGVVLTITATVVDGIGYVPVPAGLEVGVHKFSCVAATNNSDVSPEILLIITVER